MRGFWFRIALGALLVFIVGMSAIHMVHRASEPARSAVRTTIAGAEPTGPRSEEHTSELQSPI